MQHEYHGLPDSVTVATVLDGTPFKGAPDDDPQLLSTTVADNELVYDMIMFSSEAEERFPAEPHEAVYGRDFGIIHFDHPGGVGFQAGADKLDHERLKTMYSVSRAERNQTKGRSKTLPPRPSGGDGPRGSG